MHVLTFYWVNMTIKATIDFFCVYITIQLLQILMLGILPNYIQLYMACETVQMGKMKSVFGMRQRHKTTQERENGTKREGKRKRKNE